MERSRQAEAEFSTWLTRAWASAHTSRETAILTEFEKAYAEYEVKRKKARLQFDQGQRSEAFATLLHEVGPAYDKAHRLCEEFSDANERYVEESTKQAGEHVAFATWAVSIGSFGTAGLAVMLLWLVIGGVLFPLRRMVADARVLMNDAPGGTAGADTVENELRSIGAYFQALMADVAETRTTLADSRNRMLNAEKLASVGKLAASVAHEMRNPLSSMKMWLYSIRKTAAAEPTLDHKYQILSEEITRLENIVRNVMEFSRSPVLKLQPHGIVPVIEKTLELAPVAGNEEHLRGAASRRRAALCHGGLGAAQTGLHQSPGQCHRGNAWGRRDFDLQRCRGKRRRFRQRGSPHSGRRPGNPGRCPLTIVRAVLYHQGRGNGTRTVHRGQHHGAA